MSNRKVYQIILEVRNVGTAATTVPVRTHVKINGYAGWSLALKDPFTVGAGLAPNAATFLIGAVPGGPPGRHTLWVKVDSENVQAELNENNNEATATTTCN